VACTCTSALGDWAVGWLFLLSRELVGPCTFFYEVGWAGADTVCCMCCRESQVSFVVLQPPFAEFKPLVERTEKCHEPVQVNKTTPPLEMNHLSSQKGMPVLPFAR
jgi:hypothetical protein